MEKIIHTGHKSFYIEEIGSTRFDTSNLNAFSEHYTNFYIARRYKNGMICFYMAKGYNAPHVGSCKKVMDEIHVWYPQTKSMWSGLGYTFEEALQGAMTGGWLYA